MFKQSPQEQYKKSLVPNKTDNRSTVPWKPCRIIGSIRRCPSRKNSSSNFRWKDCRHCLVVGQLEEDLLCEDGPQFCPPVDKLVQLLSAATHEFEQSKTPLFMVLGFPILAWPISSFSFLTSCSFRRSSNVLFFKVTGFTRTTLIIFFVFIFDFSFFLLIQHCPAFLRLQVSPCLPIDCCLLVLQHSDADLFAK